MLGRHRALRRHPGVAERVRAGPVREIETLRDLVRQSDILEQLDALAESENIEPGMMSGKPRKEVLVIDMESKNRVATVFARRTGEDERSVKLGYERGPVI